MESLPIHCYIYLADAEDATSMKTILHIALPVNKRQKPDDYHYREDTETIALKSRVERLETYAHNIVSGFVPMFEEGSNTVNWTIYQWADGTTSFQRIKENPSLAGTEVIIGTSVYKYHNAVVGDDGVVPVMCGHLDFQRIVDSVEDGVINNKGHHTPCGYKAIKKSGSDIYSTLILYDENEETISADSDGDIEQCAILYDKSYGVKGFKINGNTQKVYLSDFVVKGNTDKGTVLSANSNCKADSPLSIVGGSGCTASGRGSIALGSNSSAGNDCSVAIGGGCTSKGSASVAMGGLCTATGGQSVALGASSAYMSSSFAAGGGCCAGTLPTSDNQSPNSGKNGAVAIGASCYAEGSGSIAIGTANKAICDWSTAIGVGSIANAPQSVVINGRSKDLKPNTAISATNSVVIGNSYAYSPNSFAFGENCKVGFEPTDDAQSVTQNSYCYAFGNGSTATGNTSFAMGAGCAASGHCSFVMGGGCAVNENNYDSVAMGGHAIVESNASISFVFGGSSYIHAGASRSIALGSGVSVWSGESAAIGCGCVAGYGGQNGTTQSSNFCFGSSCTSRGGSGSVATGRATIASSPSQFVAGKYNLEDNMDKYGFILGNGEYDSDAKKEKHSNAIAIDWQGKIYVNGSNIGVDVLDLLNRVKALEEALDGLKLKKTTTSEYNSLSEKDTNTVYLCTDN